MRNFRFLLFLLLIWGLELHAARVYQLGEIQFDLHELESVPEGEVDAINNINGVFNKFFEKQYSKETQDVSSEITIKGTRRGVHPRAHGCIEGTLRVEHLPFPSHDQAGLFKEGMSYPLMARFSNADPRGKAPDSEADSRGLAIKIQNVYGERVLSPLFDPDDSSQVFTFNSTDRFFADSAERYLNFMEIALLQTDTFGDAIKKYIIGIVKNLEPITAYRTTKAFFEIQSVKTSNLFRINYFSISASQHGSGTDAPTVKYALFPCQRKGYDENEINPNNPYFLRENLIRSINAGPACFKFMIQRNLEKNLGVENLTVPWTKKDAPFHEIARIYFPQQQLMDDQVCEKERFNPWTSLNEHRPLGGINRLRLGSYFHSIKRRFEK